MDRDSAATRRLRFQWERGTGSSFAPLIAGTWAFTVATLLAPSHGTRDFYATCAQIIPVLLLALALEARIFRVDRFSLDAYPFRTMREENARLLSRVVASQRRHLLIENPDADVAANLAELDAMHREIVDMQAQLANTERYAQRVGRLWTAMRSATVGIGVAVLAVGELTALLVLAGNYPPTTDTGLVFGAIAYGFAAILALAVLRSPGPDLTPAQKRQSS